MSEVLYIAFDFDGTYVEHSYPKIGKSTEAPVWLRLFAEHGAKLILWTFRHGGDLEEAVKLIKKDKVPLHGVNTNPDNNSGSPKAYATLVIDDISFGVPLRSTHRGRPVVDWSKVGPAVATRLQIPQEAIKKAFEVESQRTLQTLMDRLEKLEAKVNSTSLETPNTEQPEPTPDLSVQDLPKKPKCDENYSDFQGLGRPCQPWEGCGLKGCPPKYTPLTKIPVTLLRADE